MRLTSSAGSSDYALLVAVPVDRAEFDEDWQARTDFLRSYSARVGQVTADGLWRVYEPYARHCLRTIEAVRDVVEVRRRATLKDLAGAIARRSVVTLVAHSRDATVVASDIRDVDRVRAALRQSDATADGNGSLENLVGALNRVIDDGPALPDDWDAIPSSTRASLRVTRLAIRWSRRRTLEWRAGGGLAPAVGIELADGVSTIEAIDHSLPPRLAGTLDLTVCESVVLADVLRLRRSTGVILANAEETSPDFRFSRYRETIALLRKRPQLDYLEAAMKLRSHMKRPLCRH